MFQELEKTVRALQSEPLSYLTSECVLALGAFLYGVKHANAAVAPRLVALADRMPGGYEGDACTRAYLSHRNTREAMDAVLVALLSELDEGTEIVSTAQPAGTIAEPIGWLRDAMQQGRPGMVVLEPRILWFADYLGGYQAGVRLIDEANADEARRTLRDFERWLRDQLKSGPAPWHAIVHVHGGPAEDGLRRFLHWWDSFCAARFSPGIPPARAR